MDQHKVHNYMYRYLEACGGTFLHTDYTNIEIQLNRDLDEELMNRPFYWHYLEKTGRTPEPMKMRLTTDMNSTSGYEKVHFGSPRLHQIFQSAGKKGAHTRLYEQTNQGTNTPLYPWLGLNVRISYTCHRRRDDLRSFGVQLISGETVDGFMDTLREKKLVNSIPELSFKMAGLVQPTSAVRRIKQYLLGDISNRKHEWADEATKRMNEDLILLDRFYEEEEVREDYDLEKKAIKEQYQPAIELSFINGGIFYLQNDTQKKWF
ncbi:YqhG family protein [Geomicrobium sp. JSM 1781026]|uniref:YqhG family protein n=1 Tax=Geomicrobium sp. JSM 1781026 TaxID=3344580 RepID=UPI0035C04952